MLKSLRKTLAIAAAGLMMSLAPAVALVPAVVSADDIGDCLSQGSDLSNLDVSGSDCTPSSSSADASNKIQGIVTTVVNIFSVVVGIVAVIMVIWGGFKYITSGGDQGNVTSAKQTIMYAIIGLVIVALAQFLVQFVLNKVVSS